MTMTSEKAQDVLAAECRHIRNAWAHTHVSTIISAAQRTAKLVAEGLLDRSQVHSAVLTAAEKYISDRQCRCTQQSIRGYIDAAIDTASEYLNVDNSRATNVIRQHT